MKSLKHRFLILGFVLTILVWVVLGAFTAKKLEWSGVYIPAAQRLFAGESLYPPDTGFVYPPFAAFLAMPFIWMPTWLSNLIFQLISLAAMIFMIWWCWRLAGGSCRAADKTKREVWAVALAMLCALRFSLNALAHGQTDLLIGALLVAGTAALINQESMLAGGCWGLAAAFKGPPLLLIGYLLWRGRVASALMMLVVFLGVNLLPDLLHRSDQGPLWIGTWFDQYCRPLLGPDRTIGEWKASVLDNQSISGVANRWLTKAVRIDGQRLLFSERPEPVGPSVVRAIVYSAYGLLGILSAIAMWPPFRRLNGNFLGNQSAVIHLYTWEVSIALILILLVSPMSSRAHFCTLLLPAMCLARAAMECPDGVARACIFIATGFSLISFNLGVVPLVHHLALYLGFVTFATLSLLLGCWWRRGEMTKSEGRNPKQ